MERTHNTGGFRVWDNRPRILLIGVSRQNANGQGPCHWLFSHAHARQLFAGHQTQLDLTAGRLSGAAVTAESISEDKMGPYNCITPCELELKRKRTWRVDFELDGYKPVSGLLKPVVSGEGLAAGAGNALIGGLIGVGIDAGTGANLDLRPNPMIAELETVESPEASRILDAEIIIEDETGVEGAAEEEAEMGEASEESPDEVDEMDEPAPASDPSTEGHGLVSFNEANPDASPKNVNFESDRTGMVAVGIASPEPGKPDHAKIRLYKPGEHAPNDEESGDLNLLQLEKIRSVANQDENS